MGPPIRGKIHTGQNAASGVRLPIAASIGAAIDGPWLRPKRGIVARTPSGHFFPSRNPISRVSIWTASSAMRHVSYGVSPAGQSVVKGIPGYIPRGWHTPAYDMTWQTRPPGVNSRNRWRRSRMSAQVVRSMIATYQKCRYINPFPWSNQKNIQQQGFAGGHPPNY